MASLSFLPDRNPRTNSDGYFASLADYRDGAVLVAHYAGTTEWERHPFGDEIVLVLDGATTIILLADGEEVAHRRSAREFVVVPRGVRHRFETSSSVEVMSVTPQPTDHQVGRPRSARIAGG